MSRGIGGVERIQELVPESLAIVVALLTQLGDLWFLTLVVVSLYWVAGERRAEYATIMGLALAGFSLLQGFKYLFRLPRPGEPLVEIEALPWVVRPLYELTATAGGYGFPSGHAFMTTVVYFGLAGVLTVGTRRRRYAAAAALVTVVSLSRIALGVHYLVDIVVGAALGLAFLVAARRFGTWAGVDRPSVVFGIAVASAAFFMATSGVTGDAVILLGVSLGAFAGWQLVILGRDLAAAERPSAATRPLLLRGGLAVAALAPLAVALEEFALLSLPARGGAAGLAAAALVTVPVLRHSDRARRGRAGAAFWAGVFVRSGRALSRPSTWRAVARGFRTHLDRFREWVRERRSGQS